MIRLGRIFAVALLLSALLPGVAFAGESDDKPLAELPSEYAPALDVVADHLGVPADQLMSASSGELQTLLCSKLGDSSPDVIAAGAKEALVLAPQQQLEGLTAAQRTQLEARLPSLIAELQAEYCLAANRAGDESGGGADAPAAADGTDGSADGSGSDKSNAGGSDSDGSNADGSGSDGSNADGSGSDGSSADRTGSDGSSADGSGSDGSSADGSGSDGSETGAPTSASDDSLPTRVDAGGGGAADGAAVPLAFGGLFASLFGLFGVGMVRRQRHS